MLVVVVVYRDIDKIFKEEGGERKWERDRTETETREERQ